MEIIPLRSYPVPSGVRGLQPAPPPEHETDEIEETEQEETREEEISREERTRESETRSEEDHRVDTYA